MIKFRFRKNCIKILPKHYGRTAFYLCFNKTRFRVYKVEYFFSSVGGAWVLEFFISRRDLDRFKRSKYCENGRDSFWIADITIPEIKSVLRELRMKGKVLFDF